MIHFSKSLILLFLLFSIFSKAQDTTVFDIGGALRFNYNYSTWKESQKKRGGDFGYDVFRINVKGSIKGVKLNTEYRFYSGSFGGGMLKQGWLEYGINRKNILQLGLTQVPFGITTYNSNNWFFNINYYVGLEDDYDMGLKYIFNNEALEFYLAYFKNAEELNFGNNSDHSNSRYSYDIASKDYNDDGTPDLRNKEVHQVNGKVVYKFNSDEHRIGTSIQYGGVYNLDTELTGNHFAFAAHYELTVRNFNLKTQFTNYRVNPKNQEGETNELVAMTAYGTPYLVATKASSYTIGLKYTIPVKGENLPLSKILCYNDFGYLDKKNSAFSDTYMNVTGIGLQTGEGSRFVLTYIDFAAGKHMPWLNSDYSNSLGTGSSTSAKWEMRFNINIGYYF